MDGSGAEGRGGSRAGRDVGRALRQLRAERGWSQRVLSARLGEAARARGRAVGVNAEMVSRWENGHRTPDPFYRRLIGDVLGLAPDHWEADVDRRQFLSLTGGVAIGGVASGRTLAELLRVTGPVRADDLLVDQLRATVEALQARYAGTAPSELLAPVSRHLQQVTSVLHEPQPLGMRAKLCRLGGELAGLRGRLAAHTEDSDEAGAWYRLALSLATEADENLLAGWITGVHALFALYEHDHEQARELVARGLELTAATPTSPTRAWLFALAARAEAALGRPDEARQALDQARDIRGTPTSGERRNPIGFVGHEVDLSFHEGLSFKRLGELAPAERRLEETWARCRSSRGRFILELEKADLHLRRDQPDEAAHVAATALEDLPSGEVIAPIVSRVDQLRAGLRPWSDAPAVRHLDETWAALTA